MTADRRPLATPEDLAEYLAVPLSTIYKWRRRRFGPKCIRVGKHIRYTWRDIEAWVEQQAASAA